MSELLQLIPEHRVITTVPAGGSPAELFAVRPVATRDDFDTRWDERAERVVASYNALAGVPLAQIISHGVALPDEREAFEAHARAMGCPSPTMERLGDSYRNPELAVMWRTWKARAGMNK